MTDDISISLERLLAHPLLSQAKNTKTNTFKAVEARHKKIYKDKDIILTPGLIKKLSLWNASIMLRESGLRQLPNELKYVERMLDKLIQKGPWVNAIIESILSDKGYTAHLHGDGDRMNFPHLKPVDLFGYGRPQPVNIYHLTKVLLEHRLEIRKWSLREDQRAKEVAVKTSSRDKGCCGRRVHP